MSDIRVFAQQQNVGRTSDGNIVGFRGTRDGAGIVADWYTALALEGRCFTTNHGEGTTPVAVTAALDVAKADVLVHCPDQTVIIPTYIGIAIQDTISTSTILDILAIASATTDASVAGTALTIYNVRTDAPRSSGCTATGTITSGGTSPYTGNYFEFFRPEAQSTPDSGATATGAIPLGWKWSVGDAAVPPIIVGAGSLSIFCANDADAMTVFLTAQWAELPESAIA